MTSTAYDEAHFRDNYPPGMEHFYWTKARNRVLRYHLGRHPEVFPLLEVGCGTGIVTAYLRRAGLDVMGIELGTPTVVDEAKPHVLTGQDALTTTALDRGRFRGIGLFDVIEHIADAPAFMRSLLEAYPSVDHLIVTVPAAPELWSNYDDHFGHFRRYTPDALAEHLERAGLRPVLMRGFFHGLYWVMRAARAIGGDHQRQVRFEPPVRQPWRGIHATAAMALDLEQRILPPSWRGSSILAIAERHRTD